MTDGDPGAPADASWLIASCPYSAADQLVRKVALVAVARGILLYDPQRNVVFGNTRPVSARHTARRRAIR